jgi:hypothetical protein
MLVRWSLSVKESANGKRSISLAFCMGLSICERPLKTLNILALYTCE